MTQLSEPPPITKPWSNIEEYYTDLVAGGAPVNEMLSLVRQIRSSRFASLYAWTSMLDLLIVQTPVNHIDGYGGNHLRISPLDDGKLEFRFVDGGKNHWKRIADSGRSFERLQNFLYAVHWFYPESTSR